MTDPRVVVLSSTAGERLAVLAGDGTARAVVGPHIGARHRTMALLELAPGASTVELRHHSEAVYYVRSGVGVVVEGARRQSLEPGAMVHVQPGAAYRFQASEEPLELIGGPSPPDPALHGETRGEPVRREAGGGVRLFHRDRPSLRLPMISSDARLVVWPGVDAHTANMNWVRLEPGEENQPHSHPESEDTIFILAGAGSVDDLTNDATLPFRAGDVIHIPPGVEHRVKADAEVPIESVGGPCPPDRVMLRAAQAAAEGGGQ